MDNSKIADLAKNQILQNFIKYQSDPEYRVECQQNQEHEIALIQLQKLLWAIDGTVKNTYDIDMTPYKNMTTQELRETYARLHYGANNKTPKYSLDDLRKLLECDQ